MRLVVVVGSVLWLVSCGVDGIDPGRLRPVTPESKEKTPSEASTPHSNPTPAVTPAKPLQPETAVVTPKDINQAAQLICSNKPGSAERKAGIQFMANYKPRSRSVDSTKLGQTHGTCVSGVLPGAIWTNLRTGVPTGTLVGQAVQETGWCTSVLAVQARNFHGQKAKFAQSAFTYWEGDSMEKSSSESTTGSGNEVVSRFMKFQHVDDSFYSVAERFMIAGLPYRACMNSRENPVEFMNCVGKSWAVHADYAQVVLAHRTNIKVFDSQPLSACELQKSEWQLDTKFQF